MGIKKWVKINGKLTWGTQTKPATLILTEKDRKTQPVCLNETCTIQAFNGQYKNRDFAFELTLSEDKSHLLAAESEDLLKKWLHKLHDAAGLRKDHLFGGESQMGGGGGREIGSGGGGGGGGKEMLGNSVAPDGDTDLQDNLLYDSCDCKFHIFLLFMFFLL